MANSNFYQDSSKDSAFYVNDILVFIPKEKITVSDEYKQGDHYKVKDNLNSPFQKRRINLTLEFLKQSINKDSKILDIGCGEGYITNEFTKYISPKNIAGCDYSISAIKEAKNNFPEIDFCVADVYNLPYKDKIFNIVVCNNILEHLENPLLALSEIKRVLKSNGYLIISTPSRYRIENFLRILFGKEIKFMSNLHITEYTVGQIIEQLKFLNFSLIKCRSCYISCSNKSIYKFILNFLKRFLTILTKIIKSHHIWESTAFYLFRKDD